MQKQILVNGVRIEATYRRGFAQEVRLTCAEFMVGTCERCLDNGEVEDHCPRCQGTGRVEGVARELFERHPITTVRLVDRKPESVHISGGYRAPSWTKGVNDGRFTTSVLPDDLYQIVAEDIQAHTQMTGMDGSWATCFDTDNEANAALSVACVAYGRELAGLPALA